MNLHVSKKMAIKFEKKCAFDFFHIFITYNPLVKFYELNDASTSAAHWYHPLFSIQIIFGIKSHLNTSYIILRVTPKFPKYLQKSAETLLWCKSVE